MQAFTRALVDERLLGAGATASLFTRHNPEDTDITYSGYGWVLLDTPAGGFSLATHSGSNGIFYANTRLYLDEGVHLFVAVNSGEESGILVTRRLRVLVTNYLSAR